MLVHDKLGSDKKKEGFSMIETIIGHSGGNDDYSRPIYMYHAKQCSSRAVVDFARNN